MPHMANLPWMEMYLISQVALMSMNCLPITFNPLKSMTSSKPNKMKWEW